MFSVNSPTGGEGAGNLPRTPFEREPSSTLAAGGSPAIDQIPQPASQFRSDA
jgi:hypothetical protein